MSIDIDQIRGIDPPVDGPGDEDGRRPLPPADVHVVGGGLGGLTAAAFIARAGHRVVVHERKRRAGGSAVTDEQHGYRFNLGPHALYRGGEAERVLRALGVTPRGVSPALRGAQMLLDGELHLAPGDTASLLRTSILGVADKARLARLLTWLPKADPTRYADRTVAETVAELTDRPRLQQLLLALVRLSCYGNAPDSMSGDVAIGQLQLSLGNGVHYLHGGWQQLVDALAATPGVRIVEGDPVRSLDDLDGRLAGGIGAGGAPVIVAAGGPRRAATITGHAYPAGTSALLASLDLGLTGPPPTSFVLGVDEPLYLSDHGVADGMAPPGAGTVTIGRYVPVDEAGGGAPGAGGEDLGGEDLGGRDARDGNAHDGDARDEDAGDGNLGVAGTAVAGVDRHDREALWSLAERAGIRPAEVMEERYLHRMQAVTALPLATSGGLAGRAAVTVPGRPGVFVAGDWVGRRGHLADAVLASAEEAALACLALLDRRPAVQTVS